MIGRSISVLGATVIFLVLFACSEKNTAADATESKARRPNILLIVVDDMGFADLGSFGSEIPTPHLDKLAYDGLRLTNFITAPACSPTRAMLLTGVDAHKAGLGNLKEELAPNQTDQPGYEGYLNNRVVTIATLLRDSGYHTYHTGKWHLGTSDATSPQAKGFERTFGMLTNASHFSDMRPAYSPDPDAKAAYRDETGMLQALPPDFDYSSQYYVDRMIDYIELDSESDEPFFAYLAFSAPHWPLQAPIEAIDRFRGAYDEGYDVILQRRLDKQKQLGVVAEHAKASDRAPKGQPWNDLTAQQQKIEARSMEIYAAMIAEIDRHTGRLIDHLKEHDQFENTVIIFMSDNGAEGHDYDDTWPADAFPAIRKTLDEAHDFSFQNMGRLASYTFYGPNWARVSAPSMRLYKAFPTEGGVRTAAFVYFPKSFSGKAISDELIVVKDLAPTILELANVMHPGQTYAGKEIETMTGVSALSLFRADTERSTDEPRIHVDELIGKRGVRVGPWKLVHMPAPYGNGDWQLYDLTNDPSESVDLADTEEEKVRELIMHWQTYAEENGVILPDWVSGY